MNVPGYTFEISAYSSEEATLFLPLFDAVWPNTPNRRESVQWAFQPENWPSGILIGAHKPGKRGDIVGARGSIQWPLSVPGVAMAHVHQFHGTCVHPEARRQGVFSALNAEFLQRFEASGGDAVFNVSVAASRAGYEKQGWSYLRGLRRWIFIPSSGPLAIALLRDRDGIRGRGVPIVDQADPIVPWGEVAGLRFAWEQELAGKVYSRYDENFYRWRFSRRGVGYRYVYRPSEGWISYRVTRKARLEEVLIGDIWLAEMSASLLWTIVRCVALRHPRASISMLVTDAHPVRPLLMRSGWLPSPQRSLNLGVRSVSDRSSLMASDLDWALTSADIDTY